MISNTLLKIVSGFLLAIIVAVIVLEIGNKNPAFMIQTDARHEENALTDAPAASSDTDENESSRPAPTELSSTYTEAGSRLVVGALGATPAQNEIVTISEIPWLTSQINRAFRDAEDASCTLLAPDVTLERKLGSSQPGGRRSLGRIPALTVGLEIDESAKKSLPVTTKGAIQGYLREHRLAIEPTVYEGEEGKLYFGTDCRAAFYKPSSPISTVKAEPMIDEAIGRFRALGVLGGNLATNGRTLLMAFRYVKSASRLTAISGGIDTETELLFLHLDSNATPQNLKFSAFVTSA
jgi:hypothetical protein